MYKATQGSRVRARTPMFSLFYVISINVMCHSMFTLFYVTSINVYFVYFVKFFFFIFKEIYFPFVMFLVVLILLLNFNQVMSYKHDINIIKKKIAILNGKLDTWMKIKNLNFQISNTSRKINLTINSKILFHRKNVMFYKEKENY